MPTVTPAVVPSTSPERSQNAEVSDACRPDSPSTGSPSTDDQNSTLETFEGYSTQTIPDEQSNVNEQVDQISDKISQDARSASETSAPGFSSDFAAPDRSDIDKSDGSADGGAENQCSVTYFPVIGNSSGCTKKKPRIAVEVSEKLTVGGGNENTGEQPALKPATVPVDLSAEICQNNTDNELEVDGFACDESAIDTNEMANVDDSDESKEKKKRMHGEVYDRAEKHGVALEDMRRSDDGSVLVGTIIVRNNNFEKVVGARHSLTGWATYTDTIGQWMETLEGEEFDRFQFSVNLPDKGSYYMEIAFFYDYVYWDNNDRQNHVVYCKMLWEDSAE